MIKRFVLFIGLLGSIPHASWAQSLSDEALHSLKQVAHFEESDTFQVASVLSDSPLSSARLENEAKAFDEDDYSEPLFSANKFHKYMGIGAVIMGGITAITAPDDDDDDLAVVNNAVVKKETDAGFHETAALTAAGMAALATASGFLFHLDDISISNGLTDPDNMHMALGLLGTLGYITAVATAPDDGGEGEGHATAGLLGGGSMLLAIKLEW